MILNLPFKKWFYFTEKPVDIRLDLGVLEETCKAFGIDFWQIDEKIKENDFDFSVELLYQGYIKGCEKKYRRPQFNKIHASIWYQYMNVTEKMKYAGMMRDLFGSVVKAYKPKDKKKAK